jgi:hypothetical protein
VDGATEKKREAAAAEAPLDPWRLRLERLRGEIGDDGIERISTQAIFDILEIAQRSRGAGASRRLAKVMTELGWTAARVRDLTRGGYKEQVRGYCRSAAAAPGSAERSCPSHHVTTESYLSDIPKPLNRGDPKVTLRVTSRASHITTAPPHPTPNDQLVVRPCSAHRITRCRGLMVT